MGGQPFLLVEGSDDRHVLYALLKHYQVPEVFEVVQLDGIDRLLESIPVRLKLKDLPRMGVVMDADLDLSTRWGAVLAILRRAGYDPLPAEPAPEGTIIPPPNDRLPLFGIWLMPDNRLPGILEDFVRFLVPPDDALFAPAQSSVREAASIDQRFSDADRPKAEIHTWLAWQERPGRPLGAAITARYLDAAVPQAETLVAWVRRLFVPG